ncbi:MAG: beta-lactamase family protein [Bacteroidales bacterium]|nr:beta-lactamase family protein [Bacteroidales bacterium]
MGKTWRSVITTICLTSFLLLSLGCSHQAPVSIETEKCFDKHLLTPAQQEAIRKEIHAAEKAQKLDTLFEKKHKRQGFNGAVLVAQKGVIIYENAFGFSDMHEKTPLTLNSGFQLASISKTFTGVATLILVQEGIIHLEDSIQQFFPEFPYHNISIKDLLSHRSGLPNYLYAFEDKRKANGSAPTNDTVVDWFCKANPMIPAYNKPGCFFSYNNSNFMLLAAIISKVSGMSYPEFLKQRIFIPLDMFHTYVDTIAPDSLLQLKTTGHHGNRKREREFYDGVYGDKGIFSTVEDMSRWYFGLINECILNKHWLKEAFSPRSFEKKSRHNYGLGFRLITEPTEMEKVEYVYHGGWWAGYSTMFWTNPEKEYVIIMLSNRKSSSAYEIKPILEILDGKKDTDKEADADASDTL